MAKKLIKGNEAVAEAALRAGVSFFAGYPITPSTEVLEYLSARMPELGRIFIQAENEIAAINMVIGSAACGARSLTASSGPGISLKASGYSYAARNEVPYVVVNVQRWGVGLGSLDSAQSDYFREVKGGGHGEYYHMVFAPSSIQEMVDMTYNAWDYAEKYRMGITILSEAFLGQMMENVEMPPFKERETELDWGIDGTGKKGLKIDILGGRSLIASTKKVELYNVIKETCQDWESYMTEDAECVLVAFGLPARVCADAVAKLRTMGEKVGLIRPKTLWPYPVKAFEACPKTVKSFLSVETNLDGEMVEDVALSAKKTGHNVPVYCYAHGPKVPRVKDIIREYEAIKNNTAKERF